MLENQNKKLRVIQSHLVTRKSDNIVPPKALLTYPIRKFNQIYARQDKQMYCTLGMQNIVIHFCQPNKRHPSIFAVIPINHEYFRFMPGSKPNILEFFVLSVSNAIEFYHENCKKNFREALSAILKGYINLEPICIQSDTQHYETRFYQLCIQLYKHYQLRTEIHAETLSFLMNSKVFLEDFIIKLIESLNPENSQQQEEEQKPKLGI